MTIQLLGKELESGTLNGKKLEEVWHNGKKVRPTGWQPGPNTYVYMPLTKDFLDHSGNNIPVQMSGLISYGNDMFRGNNNGYIKIPASQFIDRDSNWTMLMRMYPFNNPASPHETVQVFAEATSYGSYNYDMRSFNFEYNINRPLNNYSIYEGNPLGFLGFEKWNLFCAVHTASDNTIKTSRNGNQPTGTRLRGGLPQNDIFIGRDVVNLGYNYGYKGNIKDVVLTKNARTPEEILDYFNQTKSAYGL